MTERPATAAPAVRARPVAGGPRVVGVVGGGQLARMLAPAAARLAVPLRPLVRDHGESVARVHPDVVVGAADAEGLRALAAVCDVLTVEHELVDLDTLRALEADGLPVRPSADTLEIAVDKVRQREVLGAAGVPVPPWRLVSTLEEAEGFAATHAWPLVAKAPRGGYDGRGVWFVDDATQLAAVLSEVDGPLLLEPALAIERELAVLVARRPGGERVVYPPVETVQVDGICHEVLLPGHLTETQDRRAREIGALVADTVDSVGILAVELFVVDGEVVLNELAARPHNAGHVTIEASTTSQFENHLRAVLDLPLGDPAPRVAAAAMSNVLGVADVDPRTRLGEALAHEGASVHLYDKGPRPGRKLGHVTATGRHLAETRDRARRAADALAGRPRRPDEEATT
jgi:5-(carboxyamino)imidazole ribonucleotide synthase